MIAGGIITGGALLGRAVVTGLAASGIPDCRRRDAADELDDLECDLSGLALVGLATTIPAAFGAGLLAGGTGRRGKSRAAMDVRARAPRVRRGRVALGWALFGSGFALYTATRLGTLGCGSYACEIAVWEGGFWASAGLMLPGLVIAPHATAYERARRRQTARSITPTLSIGPRGNMIGIAGRF